MNKGKITDHAADPGPQHWDYRCLLCGERVAAHAGIFGRLWARLKKTGADNGM